MAARDLAYRPTLRQPLVPLVGVVRAVTGITTNPVRLACRAGKQGCG